MQSLYRPGKPLPRSALAVSSDGTAIAGITGDEAMYWTATHGARALGDLPGGAFYSFALGISGDGATVVGASSSTTPIAIELEAFRWTNQAGMVGLGDLPGGRFDSVARGASADGSVVVGVSVIHNEEGMAFFWTEALGMVSLREFLIGQGVDNVAGWTQMDAHDVSADGLTIVGSGINPDGNPEGWVATIPEPDGVVLGALAAAIAMCVRGRSSLRSRRVRSPSKRSASLSDKRRPAWRN
jgi:probable HAF family extracellular repeat protein